MNLPKKKVSGILNKITSAGAINLLKENISIKTNSNETPNRY
jgi:hypothetical protein